MQVSGTFPELSAGLKRSASSKKRSAPEPKQTGVGGFSIKGRAPKRNNAPKTFAGRRAASHAKAYQD